MNLELRLIELRWKEIMLKERGIWLCWPRAPHGSGRVGSIALPDPKHQVGSGNGSKRVRMGQTGLKFDKSVILEYLDEYHSNRNDFTVIGFDLMRRIQ